MGWWWGLRVGRSTGSQVSIQHSIGPSRFHHIKLSRGVVAVRSVLDFGTNVEGDDVGIYFLRVMTVVFISLLDLMSLLFESKADAGKRSRPCRAAKRDLERLSREHVSECSGPGSESSLQLPPSGGGWGIGRAVRI